jgi:hypothetical protein
VAADPGEALVSHMSITTTMMMMMEWVFSASSLVARRSGRWGNVGRQFAGAAVWSQLPLWACVRACLPRASLATSRRAPSGHRIHRDFCSTSENYPPLPSPLRRPDPVQARSIRRIRRDTNPPCDCLAPAPGQHPRALTAAHHAAIRPALSVLSPSCTADHRP